MLIIRASQVKRILLVKMFYFELSTFNFLFHACCCVSNKQGTGKAFVWIYIIQTSFYQV